MGKTKQLLDEIHESLWNRDLRYDAEYAEWVYYTQMPHITHKDESKQDTMGSAQS